MMPIGVLEWLLAKFSEVVKEVIEEGDLSLFKGLDFHANNPEILPLLGFQRDDNADNIWIPHWSHWIPY